MRSALLALVVLAGCQRAVPAEFPSSIADETAAIRQMIMVYPDGGDSACTAWKVSGYGVWITAKHCTEDEGEFTIGGHPAIVEQCSETADVCAMLVAADWEVATLQLGTPARFGDRVHFIGFPWYGEQYHFNVYDARWGLCYDNQAGECEISTMADGGASGSPIIDQGGEVVGVLVSGYRGRPYTYAVPVAHVRALIEVL